MKKDIEQQLFEYPTLEQKASILRKQAERLRAVMDEQTETLLDNKLDLITKAQLADELQKEERVLLKLYNTADDLELQKITIDASLTLLSSVEYKIVTGYYFEDSSIQELAESTGYSYSWTHKLKAKAVSKLIDVLEVI